MPKPLWPTLKYFCSSFTAQRYRPRDLYDVIFLFRNQHLVTEHSLVVSSLEQKCKYKEIDTPDFETIEKHAKRDELESEWENMLKHLFLE